MYGLGGGKDMEGFLPYIGYIKLYEFRTLIRTVLNKLIFNWVPANVAISRSGSYTQ